MSETITLFFLYGGNNYIMEQLAKFCKINDYLQNIEIKIEDGDKTLLL